MRRTATTLLALTACLGLPACNTILGRHVQTEMLIANHTDREMTVAFDQSSENTGSNPFDVDQTVAPGQSIRFSGKEGDEVVLTAGDQPPVTLIFAKRSQTVKVSDDGTGHTSVDVYRGYTDPDK